MRQFRDAAHPLLDAPPGGWVSIGGPSDARMPFQTMIIADFSTGSISVLRRPPRQGPLLLPTGRLQCCRSPDLPKDGTDRLSCAPSPSCSTPGSGVRTWWAPVTSAMLATAAMENVKAEHSVSNL